MIALPITDEQRAERRKFLKVFGFAAPIALTMPLTSPDEPEPAADPVPMLTARDVYEIHLEASLRFLPHHFGDGVAMQPGSNFRSLLEVMAMSAASVWEAQQQIIKDMAR